MDCNQAPQSVEFSRQESWSGLPFPFPGDLPNPEIEPGSPALQADALLSEPPGDPAKLVAPESRISALSWLSCQERGPAKLSEVSVSMELESQEDIHPASVIKSRAREPSNYFSSPQAFSGNLL